MNEYFFHPIPYISDELSNPKPHSLKALSPCMTSPSKIVLSLHKCPLLHESVVDLVKVDPFKVL